MAVKKSAVVEPEFYKPAEVAQKLRVDQRVIYGMIERGELQALKVGRVFRIPAAAVAALAGPPKKE